MTYYYLVPKWFVGFDIFTELIFATITFAVAFFSFKVYRLSGQKEARLFGSSFLLISLSYIMWAIASFFIFSHYKGELTSLVIEKLATFASIGVYTYILFFAAGLITLAYTKLKVNDGRVYYIMLGLGLMLIVSSVNRIITFHILVAFLLTFAIYSYFIEYSINKNKKTLLVALSLSLLLFSSIGFIFSLEYYQAYITGRLTELLAYIFILISLILSIRK